MCSFHTTSKKLSFTLKQTMTKSYNWPSCRDQMDREDRTASRHNHSITSAPRALGTSWVSVRKTERVNDPRILLWSCLLEMTQKLLMLPQQYGSLNKNWTLAGIPLQKGKSLDFHPRQRTKVTNEFWGWGLGAPNDELIQMCSSVYSQ